MKKKIMQGFALLIMVILPFVSRADKETDRQNKIWLEAEQGIRVIQAGTLPLSATLLDARGVRLKKPNVIASYENAFKFHTEFIRKSWAVPGKNEYSLSGNIKHIARDNWDEPVVVNGVELKKTGHISIYDKHGNKIFEDRKKYIHQYLPKGELYTVVVGYKGVYDITVNHTLENGDIIHTEKKQMNSGHTYTVNLLNSLTYLSYQSSTDAVIEPYPSANNPIQLKVTMPFNHVDLTIKYTGKMPTINRILYLTNLNDKPINESGEEIDTLPNNIIRQGKILQSDYILENGSKNLTPNKTYSGTTDLIKYFNGRTYTASQSKIVDAFNQIYDQNFNWSVKVGYENLFLLQAYHTNTKIKYEHKSNDGTIFNTAFETLAVGDKINVDTNYYADYEFAGLTVHVANNGSHNIAYNSNSKKVIGNVPFDDVTISFNYKPIKTYQTIQEITYLVNENGEAINRFGEKIAQNKETILKNGVLLENVYIKEGNDTNLTVDKIYSGVAPSKKIDNNRVYELVKCFSIDSKDCTKEYLNNEWSILVEQNTDYVVYKGYKTTGKLTTIHQYGTENPITSKEEVYVGNFVKKEIILKDYTKFKYFTAIPSGNFRLVNSAYLTGTMPYQDVNITFNYDITSPPSAQKIRIVSCLANKSGEIIDSKGDVIKAIQPADILSKAIILKDDYVKEKDNSTNLWPDKEYSGEVFDFLKDNHKYNLQKIYWIDDKNNIKTIDYEWKITPKKDTNYTIFVLYTTQRELNVEHSPLKNPTREMKYVGDRITIDVLKEELYSVSYIQAVSNFITNNIKLNTEKTKVEGTMPYANVNLKINYDKKLQTTNYVIEYYRDVVQDTEINFLGSITVDHVPYGTKVELTDSQIDAYRPVGYKPGFVLDEITITKPGQIIRVLYKDRYKIMIYFTEIYLENIYGNFERSSKYSGRRAAVENTIISYESLNQTMLDALEREGYEYLYSEPEQIVLSPKENIITHYFYKTEEQMKMNYDYHQLLFTEDPENEKQFTFTEEETKAIHEIYDRLHEEGRLDEENLLQELEKIGL